MSCNIGMSLFITIVFLDKMQVLASNDDSALHLGRLNDSRQNTSTNANVASEWALFVNVSSINSFLGSLESKSNFFVPTLAQSTLQNYALVVLEDGVLLLKCSLSL